MTPWDGIVIQFEPEHAGELGPTICLDADFPVYEVAALGEVLGPAGVLTPGFRPPQVGLCHPSGFLYAHRVLGQKTILLPDRNITSRFARIVQGATADQQLRLAAAVMAFCQCLDISIEPSLAFHELAGAQGNERANAELAWFRAADNGRVHDWIAYALGAIDVLPPPYTPHQVLAHDLAFPLRRWRRNYAAALKIGALELDPSLTARERVLMLLDWMENEFIVAGPAALLACVYFAPNSPPRRGLLKQLRSADRERAIAGAKNAAWDVTHLSDFTRRLNEATRGDTRYLFASLDNGLHVLASSLFEYGADGFQMAAVVDGLAKWWPAGDAQAIAERLNKLLMRAQRNIEGDMQDRPSSFVSDAIEAGETVLRRPLATNA